MNTAKGPALYILATQMDAIQKYSSADGEKVPKLNTLGGQDWKKTKSKVKGAVQEVARDLVELYARRGSPKRDMCMDRILSAERI